MAKVEFDPGIESVRGILMGTDPFYIRRYPSKDGVMHIEAQTRITFAEQFGRQKHLAFIERTMKGQMELPFD